MAYWTARFAHDDDEAARILRDLTATLRPRSGDVAAARPDAEQTRFPARRRRTCRSFRRRETIDTLAKSTRAVLLPERFCAIGYAAGRREVFRVWGSTDSRRTRAVARLARHRRPAGAPRRRPRLDGRLRRRARERHGDRGHAGADRGAAAARVRAPSISPPARSSAWSSSASSGRRARAESAADFTDLLAAHRDSTGLGFVALGTPTNNTEAAPAGYSPSQRKGCAAAAATRNQPGGPGRAAAADVGVRHRRRRRCRPTTSTTRI